MYVAADHDGEKAMPTPTPLPIRKPCTHPGCNRYEVLYGYCERHRPKRSPDKQVCAEPGCGRIAEDDGYCFVHLYKLKPRAFAELVTPSEGGRKMEEGVMIVEGVEEKNEAPACKVCGKPALNRDGSVSKVKHCADCWVARKTEGKNPDKTKARTCKVCGAPALNKHGEPSNKSYCHVCLGDMMRRKFAANVDAGACMVRLDFSKYQELLEAVTEVAHKEMRSVENQIMWIVAKGVDNVDQ